MRYYLQSLRPWQWIKNLFILLPHVFGKKLGTYPENLITLAALLVFCLITSAVYLINDVIDREKDSRHPTKRIRPIASGKVSVRMAYLIAFSLILGAVFSGLAISPSLAVVVFVYLVFNIVYSKVLKDKVILDVFCIAFSFFLRIYAGSIAANVSMSQWLVVMILLLALFLGFNKRRQEIILLDSEAQHHRSVLREYSVEFIDHISSILTTSLVIVYMLYTVDSRTVSFFGTNHLLYSIPFVYYGIFRYLYVLHETRTEDGDPTRVLLRDRAMQVTIGLWLATCVGVIYFGL